jgi:hypothetical protein
MNGDKLNSVGRETSIHFKNKKKEFMSVKQTRKRLLETSIEA